jgi:Cu-Zn family superoxide dismutase
MFEAISMVLLASGAAPAAQPAVPAADHIVTAANTRIVKADGTIVGSARILSHRGAISIWVGARGLVPGRRYGVHIHDVGRCEGPAFESAGPHWNPQARHHGLRNPAGAHLGDLPNLEIGADGTGAVRFPITATLANLLDADGASVVIHAAPDDERTDPSGNSGARIACGVLARLR